MRRQAIGKAWSSSGWRYRVGKVVGVVVLAGIVSVAWANDVSPKPARMVMGWKEYARLDTDGLRMNAKLDTGADNSSIHALNIEEFVRDGVAWVRFTVANEKGENRTLERPVARTVRIRQHAGAQVDRRYVVKLVLSLGPLSKEVEVNLVDRSRFSIPLLLGRSFLYPEILVDSGMSYTVN